MSVAVSHRITGQRRIVAKFQRIRSRLPEAFDDSHAKRLLIGRIRARYKAEVSPDGEKWPALSDKTIRNKRAKGSRDPYKKLVDSGLMYRSLQEISKGNAGTFGINTGLGFRIGIDDAEASEYARVHQYGTSRVPARPFLGLTDLDARSYREAVARQLRRIIASS